MNEKFLINIEIAGKKYPLTIDRQEEEIMRAAAMQLNSKLLQYRQHFNSKLDVKDLLAMVAFQLSLENLRMEKRNDTGPFVDAIKRLTGDVEACLNA